jgi:hypothetical protein
MRTSGSSALGNASTVRDPFAGPVGEVEPVDGRRVTPRATVDGVAPAVAGQHDVVFWAREQPVGAGSAVDEIRARATLDAVGPGAAEEAVAAGYPRMTSLPPSPRITSGNDVPLRTFASQYCTAA